MSLSAGWFWLWSTGMLLKITWKFFDASRGLRSLLSYIHRKGTWRWLDAGVVWNLPMAPKQSVVSLLGVPFSVACLASTPVACIATCRRAIRRQWQHWSFFRSICSASGGVSSATVQGHSSSPFWSCCEVNALAFVPNAWANYTPDITSISLDSERCTDKT